MAGSSFTAVLATTAETEFGTKLSKFMRIEWELANFGQVAYAAGFWKLFHDTERASDNEIFCIETLINEFDSRFRLQHPCLTIQQLTEIRGRCSALLTDDNLNRFISAAGYYWVATNHLYAFNKFTIDGYKDRWKISINLLFLSRNSKDTSLVLRPAVIKGLKKRSPKLRDLLRSIKITVENHTTNGRDLRSEEEQTKAITVKNSIFSHLIQLADNDSKNKNKWIRLVENVFPDKELDRDRERVENLQEQIHHQRRGGTFPVDQDGAQLSKNLKTVKPGKPSIYERAVAIFDQKEIRDLVLKTINPTIIMSYLSGWCLSDEDIEAIRNTIIDMCGGRALAVQRLIEGIKESLMEKENEAVVEHINAIVDAFESVSVKDSKLIRLLREACEKLQ